MGSFSRKVTAVQAIGQEVKSVTNVPDLPHAVSVSVLLMKMWEMGSTVC